MADALSGLTEVSATIETIVATEVQQVLTASMQVVPLVTDFSAMVGPGMDTLKIPKFSNFTVATKAENVAVDAQVNAFSADSLVMDKHKVVQFLIEDIASTQSKVAIVQQYIQQAAKDLAKDMDQVLLDAMEAGVSTASPDHKVAYADATALAKADFILARKLMNIQNVPLDDRHVVIDPASEASILAIGEFVKVNESGSESALRSGLIGKLFGFDVYVTTVAETAKSMFFHRSAACFARQIAPRTQRYYDVANLAERWSCDHLFGVKVLDAGKRMVLSGTA